jgi:hypothetical protein
MTVTKIERVARNLSAHLATTWEDLPKDVQDYWKDRASVALRAVLEEDDQSAVAITTARRQGFKQGFQKGLIEGLVTAQRVVENVLYDPRSIAEILVEEHLDDDVVRVLEPNDTELVEQVAAVLFENRNPGALWEHAASINQVGWRSAARATIEALRQP